MKQDIQLGADTMRMTDSYVEFFRPGTSWTEGSTGATGNQSAGFIGDAHTARVVAYNLLLWAEDVERSAAT